MNNRNPNIPTTHRQAFAAREFLANNRADLRRHLFKTKTTPPEPERIDGKEYSTFAQIILMPGDMTAYGAYWDEVDREAVESALDALLYERDDSAIDLWMTHSTHAGAFVGYMAHKKQLELCDEPACDKHGQEHVEGEHYHYRRIACDVATIEVALSHETKTWQVDHWTDGIDTHLTASEAQAYADALATAADTADTLNATVN